jgi:hypothetical protein
VSLEHLAGDLDVDGVDVVEQAGGEEAADLEDEPGENEDGEGTSARAAEGGLGAGCQLSVLSCQVLVVRSQLSDLSFR